MAEGRDDMYYEGVVACIVILLAEKLIDCFRIGFTKRKY